MCVKKSTLNGGVRRRGLSAARISSMYGRFGGLTGDISLTYGRHMRRKPQKRIPEVAVFAGDVPYISEMFPYEKQNLPYITQIDRLVWGITRSDFTRVHAAAYSRGAVRGFAVEFRTCNCTGNVSNGSSMGCPSMSARAFCAASTAMSYGRCRTVVSSASLAKVLSSNPVTEISPGMERPLR